MLLLSLKGVSAAVASSQSGFFIVTMLLGATSEGNTRQGWVCCQLCPRQGGIPGGGVSPELMDAGDGDDMDHGTGWKTWPDS